MINPDLTNQFFLESESEQLRRIHQWAHARYAAPWAAFGAVLLRVAASTGPHVQLPGIIGGRASLNLLCAFVSQSGGGKGTSDKVARLAWPTPVTELPIGSGEGIAATFKTPDKPDPDNEPLTAAIFMVPEIDTLTGLASRQGSILLAQLKSMAMGEQLGQTNAQKATSRVVAAHSYRCCLSVGAQPGHTGVIFDDATGGTPQRFLWFPTTDPDMPADPGPDPDALDTSRPYWQTAGGVAEVGYEPDEIRRTVIGAHLARQRGEADALDGHAMLTRLKVAALLAIMHQRTAVTDQDWQLSRIVMEVSDHTRNALLEHARQAARAKTRARALNRAEFDEVLDERYATTVRRRILELLTTGPKSRSVLRRAMGKQHYREVFDAVLTRLEEVSQVVTIPGEKAQHFALNREFTGEPVFTPEKTSSDGVNALFTGEPGGTVVELHNPTSGESGTAKASCPVWLAGYVEQLRADGHTQVSSFAVYQAGASEGHSKGSISQAVDKHPDLIKIGREGRSNILSLTGESTGYKPATQWVHEYLDALPANTEYVDKDRYRQAAEAAGCGWDGAHDAINNCGRVDREIDPNNYRKTLWRIRRNETSTPGTQK